MVNERYGNRINCSFYVFCPQKFGRNWMNEHKFTNGKAWMERMEWKLSIFIVMSWTVLCVRWALHIWNRKYCALLTATHPECIMKCSKKALKERKWNRNDWIKCQNKTELFLLPLWQRTRKTKLNNFRCIFCFRWWAMATTAIHQQFR